uniref:X8 domain-containing protein n=1 Tax=Oryza punctata TaxID=4537 RepID=A0A0E0MIJ2_ORYPU
MPITVPSTNPTPIIITVPSTNPTITIPSSNPLPAPYCPLNGESFHLTCTCGIPAADAFNLSSFCTIDQPNIKPNDACYQHATSCSHHNSTHCPRSFWAATMADSADIALQNALDYAFGIGGADCSAIQPSGTCYYPNTLGAHASYAFNSYYQRSPAPSSCDFGGTAMVVNVNPSSGNCVLTSSMSLPSSSVSGYNPALTTPTASSTSPIITPTTLSGSGSSVLNPDGSGSASSSEFGSDIPDTSNCWRSISPSGWSLAALFSMLAWAYMIKGTILETE